MIFVTAGTERFPFDRLIRAADELQESLNGEPVFMQTGSSMYMPSCPHERFLSYPEFSEKIREARIVISHAGAGTLLMCAELGKVPVMLARQGQLGEHVDDHQQMLAERMVDQGRIILAEQADDLRELIHRYEELSLEADNTHTKELTLVHYLKELLLQC
jgi:UDP-N-acetylglucosamine transferase subunit ALG13